MWLQDTLLHLQEGSFVGGSGPGEHGDLVLNLALCGLQGTRMWPLRPMQDGGITGAPAAPKWMQSRSAGQGLRSSDLTWTWGCALSPAHSETEDAISSARPRGLRETGHNGHCGKCSGRFRVLTESWEP